MKVGVIGHGFIGWNGGVDFIRNIAMCLYASVRAADSVVVLLPWQGTLESIPVCYGEFKSEFGSDIEVALVLQTEQGFKDAIKGHAVDIVVPALQVLPSWVEVPWIGYLYDFQHKYIPQLFSEEEVRSRDQAFAEMLGSAKTIIVNSEAVAKDAKLFFPNSPARIFAQPFSAGTNKRWLTTPNVSAFTPAKPYLIICNQFWVHKDHWTAFRAFAKLTSEFPDLELVCTGPLTDHRHPAYFDTLKSLLAATGVADRVRILGCVPKEDQIILLKGALALVQPTLFEGGPGGGAVYDAVALGVPAFVSDIPVNLEIEENTVSFFGCGDDAALAEALRQFLRQPIPQRPDADALVRAGQIRRQRCGQVLWNAIDDRLSGRHLTSLEDLMASLPSQVSASRGAA